MPEPHSSHAPRPSRPWYRSRAGLGFAGFAALAALLLAYEHRLHIPFGNLLAILPLIACVGLHGLMHGGHHRHGGHHHPMQSADPSAAGKEDEK